MSELQKALEDFIAASDKLHDLAKRTRKVLAQISLLESEMATLSAIRVAGNPYPHGSELFRAFEQARSPAFSRRRRIVMEEGCATCAELARGSFGPSHDPSPNCESGKRPHCTCDTCF